MTSTDRLIFIIGGNRGMGYVVAQTLAREPNTHVVLGCRSEESAKEAIARLTGDTSKRVHANAISWVLINMLDDASIVSATKTLMERHGRIDVLLAIAAVAGEQTAPIQKDSSASEDDMTLRELYKYHYETNVFGPAVLLEAAKPLLKASTHPKKRAVFVTSGLASVTAGLGATDLEILHGDAHFFPIYGSSKSALNAMCMRQSFDLNRHGIDIAVVDPGYTKTSMNGYDGYRPIEDGAGAIIKAATADDVNQKFISTETKSGTLPW